MDNLSGAYVRRQEMVCTEADLAIYDDKVLLDAEVIYVRMNDGSVKQKMGDGTTPLSDLPFTDFGVEKVNAAAQDALIEIANAKAEMLREIELAAEIVQIPGDSPTAVMSQKAVSDCVNKITAVENIKTIKGTIVTVGDDFVDAFVDAEDITVVGFNILDVSTVKLNTIKNDTGEEVHDNVSYYYDYKIPVLGVNKVFVNATVQRVYFYDESGAWVGRSSLVNNSGHEITLSGETAFISLQLSILDNGVPSRTVVSFTDFNDEFPTTPNLVDRSTVKPNTIKNDLGEEVHDNVSYYYDYKIPVLGVNKVFVNATVQRVYFYDESGAWVGRSSLVNNSGHEITLSGETAFISLQTSRDNLSDPSKIYCSYTDFEESSINLEDFDNAVVQYKKNNGEKFYNGGFSVYSNDFKEINVTVKMRKTAELFWNIPDFWEPNIVDDGYSMPRQLNLASRSYWVAKKYYYYDFLDAYYNKYIGEYLDGYKVTRKSLGQDSAHTGYEIFEYQFTPKNHTKTVLISAGMNCNETGGIWGLATFVRELMKHEETQMKQFYENIKFCIIPFICPSSFDREPINYYNANGVRINKNFNFKTSWDAITGDFNPKGEYPDSEQETVVLKNWINSYSYNADLWVDCHSDHSDQRENRMCCVIASDEQTLTDMMIAGDVYKEHYKSNGMSTSDRDHVEGWVENGSYPKTAYSKEICGVKAIMIEQTIGTTTFGSDGETICDKYGIKNYVAMLRLFISAGLID